jgi:hypothetical protein
MDCFYESFTRGRRFQVKAGSRKGAKEERKARKELNCKDRNRDAGGAKGYAFSLRSLRFLCALCSSVIRIAPRSPILVIR